MGEYTISEYLKEKDIVVCNKKFIKNQISTYDSIEKQIRTASYLHNILMEYPLGGFTKVKCKIGKYVQWLKLEYKRDERYYKDIKKTIVKSEMDDFWLKNGKEILAIISMVIMKLRYIDIDKITRRAMAKNEICIGNINESNIRILDNVEIGCLDRLSYNLVEEDIYHYLRQVSKKVDVNFYDLVEGYTRVTNLSKDSQEYINTLLKVPYDTLKIWKKCRRNKIDKNSININYNLKKVFNREINSVKRRI